LRDAWFDAPDMEAQKKVARELQLQLFQDLPYIPLGQYFVNSGYRRGLTGMRRGIPLPINVRRA
jgi:peptide/nickel transport system substrate-binding protein